MALNHYIGMKTLHAADFFEFKILPFITAGFALLFIITAFIGTSRALRFSFIAFLVFGIVAMADFWKWEYNYGHNLNPDAAIKVPGMAYQPPLIGYKQLLNFGAYSVPDIGGWIFIAAGAIIGALMFYDIISRKKEQRVLKVSSKMAGIVAVMFAVFISSCNTKPQAIEVGKVNCDFCKMTIMDTRFATELITTKGKVYKFDDVHCLLSYLRSDILEKKEVKEVYFVDYRNPKQFIPSTAAFLLKNEVLHSPMNGNVAAFGSTGDRAKLHGQIKGDTITWNDLYN
jgi:copper chaperone NosL